LGCGYGISAKKFAQITGMSEEEAAYGVRLYRVTFRQVVKLWNDYQRRVVTCNYLQKDFSIELPSGRTLEYGKVKKNVGDNRTNYVVYQYRGGKKVPMRAWGGLLAENASQALSRDVFSDMMLRLEAMGMKIIFHVHDEFVIEVDEEKAEDTLKDVIEVMSTPPTWIPELPLEADGKIVTKYQK
jgi:DNA polymerase